MGYEKPEFDKKKKDLGGIKRGTYVILFDGSRGVVTQSDRSQTTIEELKYKGFTSSVTMPTAQAKQLVIKEK